MTFKWTMTDDGFPMDSLLKGESPESKILCVRRGSREVFVWDYTEGDFNRTVLAWAIISVPMELR